MAHKGSGRLGAGRGEGGARREREDLGRVGMTGQCCKLGKDVT